MEGKTATQDSLQSEMVPKDKSGPVEEIDVEMQPSEQDPDPLSTNMKQETATEDSSQNKMASKNETHRDEEVKTVSVEMQSIEKECNKKITKTEEDNRGDVFGVANNQLHDETGEAERESAIPSTLTAKNQLLLLHHKIYLLNLLLVITFLIAAVSLVLAIVALTGKKSSLGEPTSAPGEKAENSRFVRCEDLNAVQENITKQREDLERIQNELSVQKENLTSLANHTSVLQELMRKNCTQGPQGLPGQRGPAGVCNMTQCQHRQINVAQPGNSSVVTLHENKHKGWKIVGATCSTVGAEEYVFKHALNSSDNTNEYSCQCKGQSKLFVTAKNTVTSCVIHFWTCPTNQTHSVPISLG